MVDQMEAMQTTQQAPTPQQNDNIKQPGQPASKPTKKHNDNSDFLKRFAVSNETVNQQNVKFHKLCFDLLAGTFVIDPAQSIHYRWLIVISLTVCYNIIFIIGRGIFWGLHNLCPTTWYTLDYLSDVIYLCDMLANSRTGYLEQGILVRNVSKLRKHYISSIAFKLDVISLLPTDIAYAFLGLRCEPNRVPCAIIVRLNRLFRFHRLAQFFDRTESATNFPFVFRISKLILYILVIIHWNACAYFAISYVIGFGSDHWVYQPAIPIMSDRGNRAPRLSLMPTSLTSPTRPEPEPVTTMPNLMAPNHTDDAVLYMNSNNEVAVNNKTAFPTDTTNLVSTLVDMRLGIMHDNDSLAHQYIYCFYWSTLTLTTIGEVPMPERDEEYLFVVVNFLIGLLIFATIVGNIGSMITNMNAARADFQHKMDSVKQWMKFRKVNKELEDRIIKWFDYLWANRQTLDEDAVTAILPDRLKAETAIHVHLETLKRVTLFRDCEPGLLVQLVLKLKLQVFSPGDYICRVGDVGKEMYIVKRGELSVLSEDCNIVFATLTDGSVFGELSILNISGLKTGNRRTANVRSVGYSDLFTLTKQDLWNVLEDYPEAQTLLVERGKTILRKDGLLGDEQSNASVTNVEPPDSYQKPRTPSLYGLVGDSSAQSGIIGQDVQMGTPTTSNQVQISRCSNNASFRKVIHHKESCSILLPMLSENQGFGPTLKRRPVMRKSMSFGFDVRRLQQTTLSTTKFPNGPNTPFARFTSPLPRNSTHFTTDLCKCNVCCNITMSENSLKQDIQLFNQNKRYAPYHGAKRLSNVEPVAHITDLPQAGVDTTARTAIVSTAFTIARKLEDLVQETNQAQTAIQLELSRLNALVAALHQPDTLPTQFMSDQQKIHKLLIAEQQGKQFEDNPVMGLHNAPASVSETIINFPNVTQ